MVNVFCLVVWWFLLGNGYHLWETSLGVALGACEIECLSSQASFVCPGEGGVVETAIFPVTFQPFALDDNPVPVAYVLEQWRK